MDRPGARLTEAPPPEAPPPDQPRARLPRTPAVLAVRRAVRDWWAEHTEHTEQGEGEVSVGAPVVALSGGPDSVALLAAAITELGTTDAIVVDHGLQEGSAQIARQAVDIARQLGARARVVPVRVEGTGGVEAAARRARYAALDEHRDGRTVLLGHTLDDQAETVLLGFGRGSGPRSVSGMRPRDAPWGRPLLTVRRADTVAMCADLGVTPWCDPHNADPRFTRVRLRREILPALEDALGGGVAEALARTAIRLDEDEQFLDGIAVAALRAITDEPGADLPVDRLEPIPPPIRRRLLRRWLLDRDIALFTDRQLRAIDDLVGHWRGQGAVAVAGGGPRARLVVTRRHGRLSVEPADR